MTAKKTTLITIGVVTVILIWSGISDARHEAEVQRDNQIAEILTQSAELQAKLTKLENKKPQVITKTVEVNTEPNLSQIIAEWTPRVAYVVCGWNQDGIGTGSGIMAYLDNVGIVAITNRHVIEIRGYIPNACVISNSTGEYEIDWISGVSNYQDPYFLGLNEDFGYIRIDKYNQELSSLVNSPLKLCYNVNIGDKLVVLGYPYIGSQNSITATEGIISGVEPNYYVTSAKIEHGNSGGAAILLKDNCYLGIPSASVVGTTESLGRILKAEFVIK